MVYDCFLFFNELELLELRLHELADVVDRFVIVEATHTHTGLPKPLHFAENRHRFRKFKERILHVVVREHFPRMRPGKFADYQRDAVRQALADCRPDDIILFSDVDEIPCPDKVREIVEKLRFDSRLLVETFHRLLKSRPVLWTFRKLFKKRHPFVWVFEQRYFMYFFNCVMEQNMR